MPTPRKNVLKIIFFALFFTVFIIGIFALYYYKNTEQNKLLKEELRSFIILPVTLNNKTYTIEDGVVSYETKPVSLFTSTRVLRIAYSATLNRFAPLFALEGTDPDELKRSIEDLDVFLTEIASLYGKKESKIIKNTFHPIDFLNMLANTEQMRQKFIYSPSDTNSAQYYRNLMKLIDLYITYTDNLKNIFEDRSNSLNNLKIHFVNGTSTPFAYILALEAVASSAENKKTELKKRIACLNYFSSACPSLQSSFKDFSGATQNRIIVEPDVKKLHEMPEIIYDNKKIIDTYLEKLALIENSQIKKDFPLIVLQHDQCFIDLPFVYYQPSQRAGAEKKGAFNVAFLNDLYFYDTKNYIEGYLFELNKRGIRYLYQSINNPYMCPDAGANVYRVITIDTIRNMLSTNALGTLENANVIGLPLRAMEQKILTGNVVLESDIDAYINGVRSILIEYGEKKLSQHIGVEKVLYAEKLISVYEQGSPRTDEIIRYIIYKSNVLPELIKTKTPVTNLLYLFLTRSYPLTLLLTHNKSVIEKTPAIVVNAEPFDPINLKLVSYNKMLKHIYSVQEIPEIMISNTIKLFRD